MNLPSLINVESDIQELTHAIECAEGEITPEQEAQFAELILQSENKVSSYVHVLERLEREQEFVKANIKRAQEYIKSLEANQSRLEKIALKAIQLRGGKLQGANGHWLSTRVSKSVIVDEDPSLLPEKYTLVTTSISPHKKAIKEALEVGVEVEGCYLETKTNLSWK